MYFLVFSLTYSSDFDELQDHKKNEKEVVDDDIFVGEAEDRSNHTVCFSFFLCCCHHIDSFGIKKLQIVFPNINCLRI
jgi:hypothetical protein